MLGEGLGQSETDHGALEQTFGRGFGRKGLHQLGEGLGSIEVIRVDHGKGASLQGFSGRPHGMTRAPRLFALRGASKVTG